MVKYKVLLEGAVKKLLLVSVGILCLSSQKVIASEIDSAKEMPSSEVQTPDYASAYSIIIANSNDLGGLSENSLRYSVLSYILDLSLDADGTISALERLRDIAFSKGDDLMASVISDLLVANSDASSDISSIFAGRKGLPPIPTPPGVTYRNSSSSDY